MLNTRVDTRMHARQLTSAGVFFITVREHHFFTATNTTNYVLIDAPNPFTTIELVQGIVLGYK